MRIRYNPHVMAIADVQFTFDQAIRTMGVTPERLEKLIDEGKIFAVRQGAGILIPREAILGYMAEVSAVKGPKKKAEPKAAAPKAAASEAAPPVAAAPEAGEPVAAEAEASAPEASEPQAAEPEAVEPR
jgi:excisionase family DNA binding protein